MDATSRVGFVGLGTMGSRMAANLAQRAGATLLIWNREPDAYPPLAALGARVAESPEQVAAESDAVVTILWDDAVSEEIVGRRILGAARPGSDLIEMSTLSPAATHRLAAEAARRGCGLIACPVTGSRDDARDATLTGYASGPRALVERRRPLLEAMVRRLVHVSERPEASAYLKLGNNQIIAALTVALADALRFATAGGVDPELALDTFVATFGRVPAMKRQMILDRDPTPHFTVAALEKDLRQATQTARDRELPLDLLPAVHRRFEAALAAGDGGADFSSIVMAPRPAPTRTPAGAPLVRAGAPGPPPEADDLDP